MKKALAYILFTLIVVSCSTSGGTFRMKGKFKNFNQGELLVYSLMGKGRIDTIKLTEGRFNYEVPIEDTLLLSVVFPNFSEIPVIASPGATLTMQGDASHLREVKVDGDEQNHLLTEFRLQINEATPPEIEKMAADFITAHPESHGCLYVLNKYFLLKNNAPYAKVYDLLTKMQKAAPSRLTAQLSNQLSGLKRVNVGDRLPKISAKTISGTTISTADMNGDVNVITIWSSWNYESQGIQRQLHRLKKKYGHLHPRRTTIRDFDTIVASKVAEANEKLYINRQEGFIGTSLKKDEFICNCSDIDDIIIFYKDGKYKVTKVAEKIYVGKNVMHVGVYKRNDVRTIFNALYIDGKGGTTYMKRFAVTGVTRDKEYDITQGKPGSKVLWFTVNPNGEAEVLRITLKPKKHLRVLQFDVDLADMAIKGRTVRGNMVTKNEIHRITLKEHGRSTLEDREIWFDQDILRINYEGHGVSLGKFAGDDRILVIMRNGEFYTTSNEATNHYEEGILRIMKYDPSIVWTAILNDADQGYVYLKRFTLDDNSKKQRMIGENPESSLILLTDKKYPRFEVKFGGDDSVRDNLIVDADEFIAVKSFHAKGKRLTNYKVESVTELEPRIVETDEEQEPIIPDGQQEGDEDNNEISQQEVRDRLTGQTRLFDDVDNENNDNETT